MLHIRNIALFAALLMGFSVFSASVVVAQFEIQKNQEDEVRWGLHDSITDAFTAKFPNKYQYKIFPFKYNENTVAFSGEIISTLDGGLPGKDDNIVIKVTHTFGGELNAEAINDSIDAESIKQRRIAKKLKGVLITDQRIKHKGFIANDYYITYNSGSNRLGLRTRIIYTSHAKIEQIITGNASGLYAYKSEDFFNSLQPKDGIFIEEETELGYGWQEYVSPNKIYTVKLPPVNFDYMPRKPGFTSSKRKSLMRAIITDPVINQNVIYSITAFKTNQQATPDTVKALVFSNNVARYVQNASIDSLKPEYDVKDGNGVMKTRLVITPPKQYPYINVVSLEAYYRGDIVVVKELLTGARHSRSGIRDTLFGLVDFHPEKYEVPASQDSQDNDDDDRELTIEDPVDEKSEEAEDDNG